MKKVLLLYAALVIAIAIFFFARGGSFFNFNFGGGENASNATAKVGNKTYKLILAKTDEEKVKGLSDRDKLPKDQGMLFIFSEKGKYGFWMKNMKFPIDIIYLSNTKIVDIIENAPAPTDKKETATLPIYYPSENINYVLELNAGEAKEANIKKGDTVTFTGIK